MNVLRVTKLLLQRNSVVPTPAHAPHYLHIQPDAPRPPDLATRIRAGLDVMQQPRLRPLLLPVHHHLPRRSVLVVHGLKRGLQQREQALALRNYTIIGGDAELEDPEAVQGAQQDDERVGGADDPLGEDDVGEVRERGGEEDPVVRGAALVVQAEGGVAGEGDAGDEGGGVAGLEEGEGGGEARGVVFAVHTLAGAVAEDEGGVGEGDVEAFPVYGVACEEEVQGRACDRWAVVVVELVRVEVLGVF